MKNKADGAPRLDDTQWPPIVIETVTPLKDVLRLLQTLHPDRYRVVARTRMRRGAPPWMDIHTLEGEGADERLRIGLRSLLDAARRGELAGFRVVHGFGYLPPDEVGPWTGSFA